MEDQDFLTFIQNVKNNTAIDLSQYKEAQMKRRLTSLRNKRGFDNFPEYYTALTKNDEMLSEFIDRITINVSEFYRNPKRWDILRTRVFPLLTKNKREITIWSAACSTGEESYTLAILINEFFGNNRDGWDTTMLATDISRKVLEIAEKGVYSKEKIAPLPALWKTKYFKNIDGQNVEIIDEIKKKVIYRRFNLVQKHFPFKRKLHVIFCRNVMIYFDMFTKTELINKFYEHLEPGGYLFIGHSESINRETSKFKYVMPAVYRKLE